MLAQQLIIEVHRDFKTCAIDLIGVIPIPPAINTDGRLKLLLEGFEPKARPIHIEHREGRYTSPKIHSFIDFLAERLRSDQSLH